MQGGKTTLIHHPRAFPTYLEYCPICKNIIIIIEYCSNSSSIHYISFIEVLFQRALLHKVRIYQRSPRKKYTIKSSFAKE